MIVTISGTPANGQQLTSFRYFQDDKNQLIKVLDSSGTLLEYVYDPVGNILEVKRTTLPPNQLAILNITPVRILGGETLTIMGQNFSGLVSGNVVMVGGVAATVLSATSTTLVVRAPTTTTAGQVTVTVGGVTASWGNALFLQQLPVISTLSPAFGRPGQVVPVALSGAYLGGATFTLQSQFPDDKSIPGTVALLSNNGATALLNVTLGSKMGQFVLMAETPAGASIISASNQFSIVPNSFTLLSRAATVLNVFNNWNSTVAQPPGRNSAQARPVSVLNVFNNWNLTVTQPAGRNSAQALPASVLNSFWNDALTWRPAAGRNFAGALPVSVCNRPSGCTQAMSTIQIPMGPPVLSVAGIGVRAVVAADGTATKPVPLVAGAPLLAGMTVRLQVAAASGSEVEFEVNGAVLGRSSSLPHDWLLTVPAGVDWLVLRAWVRSAGGSVTTPMVQVPVIADVEETIPVGSGVVSVAVGGLKAEYFESRGSLASMPDLTGAVPSRLAYVTALNHANPGGVFGDDPLGAGIATDFAARFSGEIWIEADDKYQFWLTARYGAALAIDGERAVNTDFAADRGAARTAEVSLRRGWRKVEVTYFRAVGPESLLFEWQPPGGRREPVGPEFLRTEIPLTSPLRVGKKFDSVWLRTRRGAEVIEVPVRVHDPMKENNR